jgi:microcystin-dependent protein
MDPYLGELRLFATDYVPRGWLPCEGQTLTIAQNAALYSILGVQFGGDGRTTFQLPDLRDRSVVAPGPDVRVGAVGGSRTVSLTTAQMPAHAHQAQGSTAPADRAEPGGARWATTAEPQYGTARQVVLAPGTVDPAGGSQPHENTPPYLALSWAIAVQGVFPSRDDGSATAVPAYTGEVRLFAGNFVPAGWAACAGQLLPIAQNTPLFALLGTNYGGDGQSTFGLPDLRDRTPVHVGTSAPGRRDIGVGQQGGAAEVTLTTAELPPHTHGVRGTGARGSTGNPSGASWAVAQQGRARRDLYTTSGPGVAMGGVVVAGGSQPHANRSPYVGITAIIALSGDWPQRP